MSKLVGRQVTGNVAAKGLVGRVGCRGVCTPTSKDQFQKRWSKGLCHGMSTSTPAFQIRTRKALRIIPPTAALRTALLWRGYATKTGPPGEDVEKIPLSRNSEIVPEQVKEEEITFFTAKTKEIETLPKTGAAVAAVGEERLLDKLKEKGQLSDLHIPPVLTHVRPPPPGTNLPLTNRRPRDYSAHS